MRTIVVIVLVISSIFGGTVAMVGVVAASSGEGFVDDGFGTDSIDRWTTFPETASGTEVRDGDVASLELIEGENGQMGIVDDCALSKDFAFGVSGSTGTGTDTLAVDEADVNPPTNTTPAITGGSPTLTTSLITDSNTGDGNEVTVEVTYDEDMAENPGDVAVTPDVNDDLTSTPSVENKRWSDARTFKADIQYTDDDEAVTGVTLAVDGATDLAGNPMNGPVSSTYDVDTDNPGVQVAEVTAPSEVTLAFDEGVYSNTDGTGALTAAEFGYSDASSNGASGIHSVSHTAGDGRAVLILDTEITNSDLGADTIDVSAGTISDGAGNTMAAGSHRYADETLDDVKPRVSSFGATESGSKIDISFTVDEKLSSGVITIDGAPMYGYTDWNETVNADGSYSYTVTHTPGGETDSSDGTYTVALASVSDGRNTERLADTTRTRVTVDTRGPTFGSLLSPKDSTHKTTPTITIGDVRDELHSVDQTTVSVIIRATDGTSVTTFSDATTTPGLSYRNETGTVRLDLSQTATSLSNKTTYDITVSAKDASAKSNSTTFSSAFTVNAMTPNSKLSGTDQGDMDDMMVLGLIIGMLLAYYLLLTAGSDY